ncbi:DUF6965 family protein [Pedobacter lithocola]|uniref:DUF6965 family protein n=1 Tax=Pedobacter lithocola TaxID=1908239 RepID=A0ABV8PGI9_9SPHI
MTTHRYILQPYKGMSSRHVCPECRQKGKFARYIDTEKNIELGTSVGKCERSDRCGFHYRPKNFFADNGIVPDHNTDVASVSVPQPVIPTSYIDTKLLSQTMANYEHNNFIIFLNTLFDSQTVSNLIEKFKIGTSKHWPGSTVFWQVDISGKVRTGKIMQYDLITGKRNKVPFDRIQWVHKVTNAVDFNLKQCLFGEHQLANNNLPIAVVESEKTAIIATGYLPQFTWVASGNKNGLSIDKCNALKANCNGRAVILYPDLNAFKEWNEKAKLYNFKMSDLLEKKATPQERENGLDLADYLIRFKVSDFITPIPAPAPASPIPLPVPEKPIELPVIIEEPIENTFQNESLFDLANAQPTKVTNENPIYVSPGYADFNNPSPAADIDQPKQKLWDIPSFEGLIIPQTLRLDAGSAINDVDACISSHIEIVTANNGKRACRPYLTRLEKIHSLITQN